MKSNEATSLACLQQASCSSLFLSWQVVTLPADIGRRVLLAGKPHPVAGKTVVKHSKENQFCFNLVEHANVLILSRSTWARQQKEIICEIICCHSQAWNTLWNTINCKVAKKLLSGSSMFYDLCNTRVRRSVSHTSNPPDRFRCLAVAPVQRPVSGSSDSNLPWPLGPDLRLCTSPGAGSAGARPSDRCGLPLSSKFACAESLSL